MPYLFLHHQNPSKYGLWHLFFKNWRCTCGQRRMLMGAGLSCSGCCTSFTAHPFYNLSFFISEKRAVSEIRSPNPFTYTETSWRTGWKTGIWFPRQPSHTQQFTVSEVLMEPLKPFYAALTTWTSDTYRTDIYAHVNFQDWMFNLQGYETV